MPARTSISGLRISRAQFGRDLAHEHRGRHAQREGDDDGRDGHQQRAQDQREGAVQIESGIPARPEEVAERHLEEGRHTFPEQEQEDEQHEGDCRETGHAHERLEEKVTPARPGSRHRFACSGQRLVSRKRVGARLCQVCET